MDNINKSFLIIICFFAFCQSMLCQTSSESKFVEQDSTIEIFKENNISFGCKYNSWTYSEMFRFIIEKDENSAEIVIATERGHHELSALELNTLLSINQNLNNEEIIKYPDKFYLLYKDIIGYIFSDLEKVDDQVYYFNDNPNYRDPYKKYTYKVQQYSSDSKQLMKIGREICFFSNDFDFELGEGSPIGTGLEFEHSVIKATESLTDYSDFKFKSSCPDFANENNLFNGNLKWTLTDSALFFQISFSLNENKSFYFNVNLESKPYIEQIVIHDFESGNIVSHYFSANGNISKSITSNNVEKISFFYDEQGFLSSKTTIKKENPNEAIKETFDIDKEYKTIVTDEGSIN